jgi:hypothetical protein
MFRNLVFAILLAALARPADAALSQVAEVSFVARLLLGLGSETVSELRVEATEISHFDHSSKRELANAGDVRGRRASRLREELFGAHRAAWNHGDRAEPIGARISISRVVFGGTTRTINLVLME